MAKKNKKFIVLSPDGFPLEFDKTYSNKKEINEAIEHFVDRYRAQGYYSKTYRERIALEDIEKECRIVEL